MSKNHINPIDDESDKTVQRFEDFLSRKAETNGYFDVEELEKIAEYYIKKGRTDDCSAALDFGFTLHPNSIALQVKRGKNLLAIGDARKAHQVLEKFSDSTDFEIRMLRLEALVHIGKKRISRQLAEQILESEGHTASAYIDMACFLEPISGYELAVTLLQQGVERYPADIEMHYELGLCYEQVGNFDEALLIYKKITAIDPFASEAWFNVGQLHYSKNELKDALYAFEYAQALMPDDSLTSMQKAHTLFQLMQYAEALDEYKNYMELTAPGWQTHLFIAECYERLRKIDDAMEHFNKSLDFRPDNYQSITGLAICMLEKEQYTESLKYSRKAVIIKPDNPEAWVYLAEGYTGNEKYEDALDAYDKAIELEPNLPDVLQSAGNVCMELRRYEQAYSYFNQALERDTDNELEDIYLLLAIASFKCGKMTEYVDYLDKALEQNTEAGATLKELLADDELFNDI